MVEYEFVANLPVSLGEVMGKSLVSCFFWRHSVVSPKLGWFVLSQFVRCEQTWFKALYEHSVC